MDYKLIDQIKNGEIHKLEKRFKGISFNESFLYWNFVTYGKQTPLEVAAEALCLSSVVFFVERGHILNMRRRCEGTETLIECLLLPIHDLRRCSPEIIIKVLNIIKYIHSKGYELELDSHPKYCNPCNNGCHLFHFVNLRLNERDYDIHGDEHNSQRDKYQTLIVIQLIKMGLDPTKECCGHKSFIQQHEPYFRKCGSYRDGFMLPFLQEYVKWNDKVKQLTLFEMMLPYLNGGNYGKKYLMFKDEIKEFKSMHWGFGPNKRRRY